MEEACFAPGMTGQNAIDCFDDNLVVYVNRRDVIVLKDGRFPMQISNAHFKTINAIVAAPCETTDAFKRTFVTCGCDGYVRLWSADSLKAVKAHQTHITRGNEKNIPNVTAVSWSRVNPNLIVSAADNGCLVQWHVAENLTTKTAIARACFTAVACSTTDENVIAAASGGSIILIRWKASATTTTLRIFKTNISSMAWQPSSEKICITSTHGELAIWDMSVPKQLSFLGVKGIPKDIECVPVLWPEEKTLLWRKLNNVLIAEYDTLFTNTEDMKCRILHTVHRRPLFGLAQATGGSLLWSAAGDRTILGFNMETEKVEKSINTLYGGCYCGTVSPHDPNLVAFGTGDGIVRIWNVTEPTGSCSFEQRNIKDRVMSVCWHPTKDNLLVYGTNVGRIGVMDKSRGKEPYLLEQAGPGGKDVYWLSFGPKFAENAETEHVLYAVKAGTVYVFDDLMPKTKPIDFGQTLGLGGVRDAVWKQDFSIFAIGCNNGMIYFYKPSGLLPVHVISVHDPMQFLAWHPLMTATESETSPYHNLFAFAQLNPNGELNVYKIEEIDSVFSSSVFATLKGHKDHVQSVAWSPHVNGHLVSTSNDNSIQVWNVLTETPIANFRYSEISWFSIWSPINPDLIISGLKNAIIQVWKISDQKHKLPPLEFVKTNQKTKKKNAHPCEEAKMSKNTSEVIAKNIVPETHRADAPMANFVPLLKPHQPIITNAWSKSSTEFHNCSRLLEKDESERSEYFRLCFFNNKKSDLKFAPTDENSKSRQPIDTEASLMIYQGKIKELIELKISDGGLNDQLVALAPSVSPRLWQAACIAYARQLRVAKQFVKAANYLLVGREVEKAVEVLCEGGQFLEALCLAEAQLPDSVDVFNNTVRLYAEGLENKGDFARAAECFIFLKDYKEVLRCLGRSQDPEAVFCAALSAQMTGNQEVFEKSALTACAYDFYNGSSKMAERFSESVVAAKLLWTVHKCLNESPSHDSLPLFEKIGQEIDVNDAKACYNQISTLQLVVKTPAPKNNAWLKTQQMSLAFCVDSDTDPRRLRFVLSVLESVNAPGELYRICELLSPRLEIEGVFAADHSLGISLRAFFCLGLLNKPGRTLDDAVSMLPLIYELQGDLMNETAIYYHRAKAELAMIQKEFANGVVTVSELNDHAKNMLNIRSKLILKISKIETERRSIPNPAVGLSLLLNFYRSISNDNELAQRYLDCLILTYGPKMN